MSQGGVIEMEEKIVWLMEVIVGLISARVAWQYFQENKLIWAAACGVLGAVVVLVIYLFVLRRDKEEKFPTKQLNRG
jgi:uncharacterized membrane protein YeaQ/YmgE (transglycosylase-associated protein family)